ncbi:putative membrane protein YjcC [mine drainage metagenome]|uniref:Putative membrane protein YjcC n=1 Tax=mine drainage metagenome TaxID=410659 RepID=A0A1J5RNH0_9ZZZZ
MDEPNTAETPPPGAPDGRGPDLPRSAKTYVAFAFASADLLLETTLDGQILFAIGAAMSLVGRPARLLPQDRLEALIRPADRARLANALRRMAAGKRVRHVLLSALTPNGAEAPVSVSGYLHPDRAETLLLALAHSGTLAGTLPRRPDGLLNKDGLERMARTVLRENPDGAGEAVQLTLLDIPEIADLRQSLGTEGSARFIGRFTEQLQECSLGGESAADFGQNRYGVIHGEDVSAEEIQTKIIDLAQSLTGGKLNLTPQSASIPLGGDDISVEEATNALLYTLNRFTADGGGSLADLAKSAGSRLSPTVARMREVRAMIERGDFDLHFQPIVDLWNSAVHHFEALVRFGNDQSPYGTVTFAEDLGLVGELDLAILGRAIAFMRQGPGADANLKFAVNLSGRSLSNAAIAARLMRMILEASDLKGRLMFEVTESAAIQDLQVVNGVIQEIRGHGNLVGLDDFGAGAAAFHYLRALKVDHVKIDGSYVREAVETGASLPFLRAIAHLCRELKIATIAEHIESQETANLLRLYNVRYGQGYYFGKAMKPQGQGLAAWQTGHIQRRNDVLFFCP